MERPVGDLLLQEPEHSQPNDWRNCLHELDGEWIQSESRFHDGDSLVYYGAGINIHLLELLKVASPTEDCFEERVDATELY
jgi:hypothetical protein